MKRIGYSQSVIFICVIALSTILVNHLGQSLSIGLLLCGVSMTAIIFFNTIRIKYIKRNHKAIIKSPFIWLMMSSLVLTTWFFSYYSAIHASATFLITLFFLWQAISATAAKKQWLTFFILLIISIAIYFLTKAIPLLSFIYAILAGISSYLYLRTSTSYAQSHQLTSVDILAIRFYLLFIFSLFMLVYSTESLHSANQTYTFSIIFFTLVILGFLNFIIPNYFSQSSVQNIGAEKFSFITSLTPVLTYVLEGILLQKWSVSLLFSSELVSVVLFISTIYDRE